MSGVLPTDRQHGLPEIDLTIAIPSKIDAFVKKEKQTALQALLNQQFNILQSLEQTRFERRDSFRSQRKKMEIQKAIESSLFENEMTNFPYIGSNPEVIELVTTGITAIGEVIKGVCVLTEKIETTQHQIRALEMQAKERVQTEAIRAEAIYKKGQEKTKRIVIKWEGKMEREGIKLDAKQKIDLVLSGEREASFDPKKQN